MKNLKVIGSTKDSKIVNFISVSGTRVEFYDDLISFKNSFFSQEICPKNLEIVIYLLIHEIPLASFNNITLGKINTDEIIIGMRDKGILIFDISHFNLTLDEKACIINTKMKTLLENSTCTIPIPEWEGWAI